jgi:hypothetical protein
MISGVVKKQLFQREPKTMFADGDFNHPKVLVMKSTRKEFWNIVSGCII